MRRLLGRLPEPLRRLAGGSLLGPVLTLLTGTVAAQGLAYLARPLLTRLFTPDAFGVLGFYLAAVTVLSTVASGKYEDAVLLPASDRDAAGVATLALGLGTLAALVSLVLLPLHGPIAAALDRPGVGPALLLVPAGLLATVWGRTAELWLTRMDRFRPISGAKVTQNAVMVPTQIGAGAAGGAALGLIGGHLAGRIAGTIVLLARAWRGTHTLVPGTADLRRLAARYRRFPLYAMPSGFLNTFSMQLPAFFLLALFAPDVLGYYVLAYGTLAVPMQLLGGAVGQVFFARAAEARWEGTLAPLARAVFGRLSALGLFPMAALTIAAPAAFSVVFGAEWREAGVYAQLLAPWLYFVFVSAPLSSLFDVLERQPSELGFNVVVVAARAAALWFGGQTGGPLGAVGLFGVVSAVLWLGHTVWMLRWSGVALGEAARVVGRHVLVAAGPLALVVAAAALGASDVLVVVVLAVAGLGWLGLTAWVEPGLWPRPAEDATS